MTTEKRVAQPEVAESGQPAPLPGTPTGKSESASKKEQHELLYDALEAYRKGVIDFEFRHATALLFILGWILSAKSAQELMASAPLIRMASTAVILLITLLHGVWVYGQFNQSREIYSELVWLRFMPSSLLRFRRIDGRLALTFGVAHLAISLVILVIIWTVRAPGSGAAPL